MVGEIVPAQARAPGGRGRGFPLPATEQTQLNAELGFLSV